MYYEVYHRIRWARGISVGRGCHDYIVQSRVQSTNGTSRVSYSGQAEFKIIFSFRQLALWPITEFCMAIWKIWLAINHAVMPYGVDCMSKFQDRVVNFRYTCIRNVLGYFGNWSWLASFVSLPLTHMCIPLTHMCMREQGFMWLWLCHIWNIYVCDPPKRLNGTLAVDSPFQTLTVDFLSNF